MRVGKAIRGEARLKLSEGRPRLGRGESEASPGHGAGDNMRIRCEAEASRGETVRVAAEADVRAKRVQG